MLGIKREYLLKDIESYLEFLLNLYKKKFLNEKDTFEWEDRKNDIDYISTINAIEELIDNAQFAKFQNYLNKMEIPLTFSCILLDVLSMTEPLVPYDDRYKWIFYCHAENNIELLLDLIQNLPDVNRMLFVKLFNLMYNIGVVQSSINGFTAKIIGSVFGGLILRQPMSVGSSNSVPSTPQQPQLTSSDINGACEDSCISTTIFDNSFESDGGDDLMGSSVSPDAVTGTSIAIFLIDRYHEIFPVLLNEIKEREKRTKEKAAEAMDILENHYKQLRTKINDTVKRIKPKIDEDPKKLILQVLEDEEFKEFITKLQKYKVHGNGRVSLKKEDQKRIALNPFLFDKT